MGLDYLHHGLFQLQLALASGRGPRVPVYFLELVKEKKKSNSLVLSLDDDDAVHAPSPYRLVINFKTGLGQGCHLSHGN